MSETQFIPKNAYRNTWGIVLGASSGFGAATAKAFAKAGMNILGIHLDRKSTMDNVKVLEEEILASDVKCRFFNVNAADEIKRKEILTEMESEIKGKVALLFHSLAFGSLLPFIETDPKSRLTKSQMDMTIDVMANSLVYWAQDLAGGGFFQKGASLYAMTSAGSSRVWKSYGAVSAAKSALESHCRQLALELAPLGVRANAILAGVTDTPALRKIPGNEIMIETATKRNPMGRLTTPEDIADAVVALSLPSFKFMTGNVIRIDGGENIVD
jgi:NAD(P)-dependent dehydrogenase (short-subunit alcohol dehydrogenase family)